ncbi:hypothetical protein [Christiangramia echinicola]|uniref:Uncharacterized protein n=1 Tax=Christiangramia echinicola TaxID=279359 RepID=A0A1H1LBX3_9FLAO|nr:hypothetical protein [Christiangramia echinicola]SDR71927.1 hypothetical protein SAMN04488552_0690 [Christiangramia echinicola]
MRPFLIFFLIIIINTSVHSQIKNSNKTEIAEFYDATLKNLTLNGGELSFQVKLHRFPFKYGNENKEKTAEKWNTFFLDLGVTNTSSFTNFQKLKLEKIGYEMGLTFQHSFTKAYYDLEGVYENLRRTSLWSFTGSVTGNLDRFDNFDPNVNSIDNVFEPRLAITGGANWFFFRKNFFYMGTLIPSINGSFNLYDYNRNTLSNYLLNSNVTTNNLVTFTSNSSFDGKYGVIDNDVRSTSLSFALPFVPDKKVAKVHITPIPFITFDTFSNSSPRYT